MFVSIVIATRNRAILLGRALAALSRQRWPDDRLEVIVADNGSSDGTPEVVECASRGPTCIRYLFVPRPGKSHAVNAALAIARGDLIAFTDDDVQPEAGWVAALATAVAQTSADFVAGRIAPIWETEPPAWMSPALYGVLAIPDNGDARQDIAPDPRSPVVSVMPIGANMAVRSPVISRIGGLRTDLGKLAGSLRTGEDHEFFLRLLNAGCRGVYEPAALVRHLVPADRLNRRYFRRWMLQNGRDVARLERAYPATVPYLLGIPRYLWRELAANVAAGASAAVRGDERRRFAAALRLIWFAGYLRDAWFGEAHESPLPLLMAQGQ